MSTSGNSNSGQQNEAGSVRVSRSSVALPAIEKLRGRENYSTWSFAMRMILIREGSWSAVEGDGVGVSEDVKLQALATICLSLESYNYSLVQDAANAKEAWKKLASAFQDSGLTRKIGLLRKFTSVRLLNCSSVEAYVDELMTTSHKLASVGFKVDDSWLAAILLMGLPEQYEPMIMGLEASGTALTADAVKAKILQDVKLDRGPVSSSTEGALYSKENRKKLTESKAGGKGEKLCFNCEKPGHFAAKCPNAKKSTMKGGKSKGLCSVFAMGDVHS